MRIKGKGLFAKTTGGLSRRPWLRFLRCSWAWRMSTPGWKPSLRQQLILRKKTKWQALKAKQRKGGRRAVAWFPRGAASPRCSSRQSGSHAGLLGSQGDQSGHVSFPQLLKFYDFSLIEEVFFRIAFHGTGFKLSKTSKRTKTKMIEN